MKKLLSFIFVTSVAISVAQIPNSSFENWTAAGTYSVPNSWGTMNNTTASYSVATATKGSPGNPGNFYLKLTSLTTGTTVTNGIAVSGKLDTVTMQPKSGFAFSQRPANFTGNWQHMIFGSSQGSILVTLTRWDTGLNQRVNVGSASYHLSGMAMSWAPFSIPIGYTDGNNPDTCIIVLKASGATPANNDYLWVDSLAFSGTVTGINSVASTIKGLNVYPNPSAENIIVDMSLNSPQKISFEVKDVTGKTIFIKNAELPSGESKQNLNLTGISKGTYFISITSENAIEVRKVIID